MCGAHGPAKKRRKEYVMKKYMLMLAIALMASAAWADVTVEVVDVGGLKGEIRYTVTGEPNKVAAFALDIVVDGGATIDAIGDFHTGVSVAGDDGYGIFPANFNRYISVNPDGTVSDWGDPAQYNPAAEAGDKQAQGGIGTNGITVELGALYKGDTNAPADSGVLCSITVSGGCNVDLELNGIRGGIVLEGAGDPTGTVTLVDGSIGPGECFPASDPAYNDWVALGKPDCWCLTTQCHGDADGLKEGGPKTGYWRVHFRDLNTLLAGWSVLEPAASGPSGPGITTAEYTDGRGTTNAVCADFAHDKEGGPKTGYFRVHFNDLTILINSWNIKEPTFGPGLATDCPGNLDPEP
jgi:hypothetical protein